jgi:membrane protease YdiL (CAAX protease family)
LGWLLLFAAVGAAAMAGLARALAHHHLPPVLLADMAGIGAVPGVLAWIIALGFAALPGARRRPGVGVRFGLVQALWGMAGTLLMMLCGAILPYMAAVYQLLLRRLWHLPGYLPDKHDITLIIASLLASELMAALWLSWYVRRQGPRVVEDGGAPGIAWRPASPRAYGMAVLGALAVLFLAGAEFRLLPPDTSGLDNLELVQLFQGPPAIALLAAMVVVFLAPVIEEVLFRGLAFAGIAARFGAGWAVVTTTIIFTALHAPEKLHYWPGFIDVAAVALLSCALRLRFRSIKPGIALHFLYNLGMLIVPAIMGGN